MPDSKQFECSGGNMTLDFKSDSPTPSANISWRTPRIKFRRCLPVHPIVLAILALAMTAMVLQLRLISSAFKQSWEYTGNGPTLLVVPREKAAPWVDPIASMCSDGATTRGPGQRVVSFSFYGNLREFFTGIEVNAKFVAEFYPGWNMRVYHDVSALDSVWQELALLPSNYSYLDLCNVSSLPLDWSIQGSHPMTWRFSPMADPLVDVFVSRDLDSRPTAREKAAVDEWLSSVLPFHVMRDHPTHKSRILGGMWGVKVHDGRTQSRDMYLTILGRKALGGVKGADQIYLADVVWPAIKGKVMQHDSYFCRMNLNLANGNMRPFPTQRLNTEGNYVGSFTSEPSLTAQCPTECRPANHTDWKTC